MKEQYTNDQGNVIELIKHIGLMVSYTEPFSGNPGAEHAMSYIQFREQYQSSETGYKLDQGKNRLGLVLGDFSLALQEVGKVGTFGAEKYQPHSWLKVEHGIKRYSDAMLRHYLSHAAGEQYDDETKLLHLAAVAWNSLAILELTLRNNNTDEKT